MKWGTKMLCVDISPSGASFATTRWSMVLAAGSSGAESLAALEALCRICWPPIYAYVRRLGHGAEESRDLTQEFFAHLLARRSLAADGVWKYADTADTAGAVDAVDTADNPCGLLGF
jgi:hypothetical protein